MKNTLLVKVLLLLFLLSCSTSSEHNSSDITREIASTKEEKRFKRKYKLIDIYKTLLGFEFTYQDQGMVDEPGRMTFKTPHKVAKFEEFLKNYLKLNKLTEKDITEDKRYSSFKPGVHFNMPGDGIYKMMMEPVTIEVNPTPKLIFEAKKVSENFFIASEQANLVPYVNPAAERSGMGHIHVGGKTLGDSPFFRHPTLLRNILVYYHKHPSLLFGFAEAYDIGIKSNIETYYDELKRKEGFIKAIASFDEWYLDPARDPSTNDQALKKLLGYLKTNNHGFDDFFRHYRNINLENLKPVINNKKTTPESEGKYTVEFRAFRPQKTPDHVLANSELLFDTFEYLADANHLEKVDMASPDEYKRFWTASRLEEDWKIVKKQIKHTNKISDEMIKETAMALRDQGSFPINMIKGGKIFHAYSIKEDKGKAYEMRFPAGKGRVYPEVLIGDKELEFEKIKINSRSYWVSYVNVSKFDITAKEFLEDQEKYINFKGFKSESCIRSRIDILEN